MLKLYSTAVTIFFGLDMIWLGLVANRFYKSHIGTFLRPDIQWGPALLFYGLFVLGLLVFVISPAVANGSIRSAIGYGALFGLISYATYDLTNLATLRDLPWIVSVVDMAWGGILGAVVSGLTVFIANRLF